MEALQEQIQQTIEDNKSRIEDLQKLDRASRVLGAPNPKANAAIAQIKARNKQLTSALDKLRDK